MEGRHTTSIAYGKETQTNICIERKWAEAEEILRRAEAGHRQSLSGHFLTKRTTRLPTVDLGVIHKEYEDAAKEAAGKHQ
jgi:hypothetical protein